MKNPNPVNLQTSEEVREKGWQAESRDADSHLISCYAPIEADDPGIAEWIVERTRNGETVTFWPADASTPAPQHHVVGADHVDKAQAWDAAQASFQKGFEKGKATALAAAGSLNEKAILVAVQNFEDETGGFGESENEKVVRGVVSAYLSALTTTEGSDNG